MQNTPLKDDFPVQQFDDGHFLPQPPSPRVSGGAHGTAMDEDAVARGDEAEEESSESAQAPQRRVIKHRTLPLDERVELRNADLASWRDDYLKNMAETKRTRLQHQAPHFAKKNAALWVSDFGIAGVGKGIGASKIMSPLDMFAGSSMMEMLTGIKPKRGKKRDHGDLSDGDSDSEERRRLTRAMEDDEFGRGGNVIQMDDDLNLQVSDMNCFPRLLAFVSPADIFSSRMSKSAVKHPPL